MPYGNKYILFSVSGYREILSMLPMTKNSKNIVDYRAINQVRRIIFIISFHAYLGFGGSETGEYKQRVL